MPLNERGQIWIRYKEKTIYCEDGETLEQVSQRSYGFSIPRRAFKGMLDGALSNLVLWKVPLPMEGVGTR